jgi:hypothetical protein
MVTPTLIPSPDGNPIHWPNVCRRVMYVSVAFGMVIGYFLACFANPSIAGAAQGAGMLQLAERENVVESPTDEHI